MIPQAIAAMLASGIIYIQSFTVLIIRLLILVIKQLKQESVLFILLCLVVSLPKSCLFESTTQKYVISKKKFNKIRGIIFFLYLQPKLIVSVNYAPEPGRLINYKELLENAVEMSEHKPHKCILYNRPMVSKISPHKTCEEY